MIIPDIKQIYRFANECGYLEEKKIPGERIHIFPFEGLDVKVIQTKDDPNKIRGLLDLIYAISKEEVPLSVFGKSYRENNDPVKWLHYRGTYLTGATDPIPNLREEKNPGFITIDEYLTNLLEGRDGFETNVIPMEIKKVVNG